MLLIFLMQTNLSVAELRACIEKYREYGMFRMSSISGKLKKEMYDLFLANELHLRGIFLMEMYQSESSDFFDIPPVPELFEIIYTTPKTVLVRCTPMFIQILHTNILAIYSKPLEFAVAIDQWAREDMSNFPIFAYSTFPGVFAYFMCDKLLEIAANVVRHYFRISKTLVTSQMLLSSLFTAAAPFYETLWAQLSALFLPLPQRPRKKQLFRVLMKSLSLALCHLSPYHITAFKDFRQTFQDKEALDVLINSLIIQKFVTVSQSSSDFINDALNSAFISMLKLLSNVPNSREGRELLDLFCNQSIFTNKYLNLESEIWSRGFQLLASDRDLNILCDIFCTSSTIFPMEMERGPKGPPNGNGLLARIINVVPKFCPGKPSESGFGRELFGDQPPTVNIEPDQESLRIWRNLEQLAREKGRCDWVDFIMNSNAAQHENREQIFGYLVLKKFHENFMTVENAIFYADALSHLKELSEVVKQSTHRLFHRFAAEFIDREIRQSEDQVIMSRVVSAVNMVCVVSENVDPDVFYEVSCCAMDSIKAFLSESQGKSVRDQFRAILGRWTETVWVAAQLKYTEKLKFVIDSVSGLMNLPKVSTGKAIKIMMQFTMRLSMILGEGDDSWCEVFTFAMFCADVPEILVLFLFCHAFVFSNQRIVGQWPAKILNAWSKFSRGMQSVLAHDPDLRSSCSRPPALVQVAVA